MKNCKKIAEDILSDINCNATISDILLKARVFAKLKNDNDLLKWIDNELNGYETDIPQYRKLKCNLKIKVVRPSGTQVVDFPLDLIKDSTIRTNFSLLLIFESIQELEEIANVELNDRIIAKQVPVYTHNFLSTFIDGEIESVLQYVEKSALKKIVTSVKMVLIDYFFKINNEEEIDFSVFTKKSQQMMPIINKYNGTVINQESGTINSSTIINNGLSDADHSALLSILEEIDKIANKINANEEYQEVSHEIKEELKKREPSKKLLKRCFQAIPSFLQNVTSDIVANGVCDLVKEAVQKLM